MSVLVYLKGDRPLAGFKSSHFHSFSVKVSSEESMTLYGKTLHGPCRIIFI